MDSYYGNVNPTLLELMRGDEQRALEFGCGRGAFARAARQRCPQLSHYVGIDIHPQAVHEAAPAMSAALCRDVDRISDWDADPELAAAAPTGTFDAVIFGDVLEHLVDPERCLKQARRLLGPRGRVLACIPNVQHWSVFVQLVRGSWPRLDSGLFDRTHLRWFTLDDMVHLFNAGGLEVISVTPRVFDRDQGLEVAEYLEPMAHLLGVVPDALSQRMLPLQYVLEGISRP